MQTQSPAQQNIVWVPVGELNPAPYNPRKWSEKATEDLKESILRFGLVDPIIVNKAENRANVIIGGHFRLHVAKLLGFKQVPVLYVNIPDEARERELNLRLNKNLGDWDFELLKGFEEDMLLDVGFESEEVDELFGQEVQEDDFNAQEEYAKIEEAETKPGDLYELGKHRLLCGDATKREDVARLMGAEKADMVFTDPHV